MLRKFLKVDIFYEAFSHYWVISLHKRCVPNDMSLLSYFIEYNKAGEVLLKKIFASDKTTIIWIFHPKNFFTRMHTMHTSPDWNRLVQKTKKDKVVQICKSLTILMSSLHGPSKMNIYRAITMTRLMLGVLKDKWNSCFWQKPLFLLSN